LNRGGHRRDLGGLRDHRIDGDERRGDVARLGMSESLEVLFDGR
jgi:hypothetical protein